ncbi:hypothetical protein B566_EDAN017354 [Ephemera danica]|nr:hypothetical protein B566_EDAN017354 [Ephemera danica]
MILINKTLLSNIMSSFIKRGSSRRSEDTMDDDDKDDTKRKSRNLSEKKRRDQFNMLINELSSMVSATSRKMDKSTVLKSTISYIRNHNEIAVRSRAHEIQEEWKPSFLSNEEFTHLILEALDGFIMVFSCSGRISELQNTNIYDLTYEADQTELYNVLLNQNNSGDTGHYPIDKANQLNAYFLFRLVFVGTGRLQTPQLIREMSIVDSSKNEFTSRHSLEWKFLFLDHRAPPIIGYLPFEVLGTSGYDYYHIDDLEKVVVCHEALMQKGEGTSCYYRFLTKGQHYAEVMRRMREPPGKDETEGREGEEAQASEEEIDDEEGDEGEESGTDAHPSATMLGGRSDETIPFQLSQQQAQLLFTSGIGLPPQPPNQ